MSTEVHNQANDPLAALLELIRTAARQGAEQAIISRSGATLPATTPLVDKRGLAHALGISPATVDRLCRDGRIPFLRVGDVRRFDLDQVRAALAANSAPASEVRTTTAKRTQIGGVRLLSRSSR